MPHCRWSYPSHLRLMVGSVMLACAIQSLWRCHCHVLVVPGQHTICASTGEGPAFARPLMLWSSLRTHENQPRRRPSHDVSTIRLPSESWKRRVPRPPS